ncbi:MAG TPA: hemolysin family protein [Pyrinomonadaceae bacterium]|jgi:CBS domain containing-hemolysin-like protein|nr:hemolysin family protein [Pyrinomonadaceae bacterium]
MAIEILIACVLLVALLFLSLVDVAFGELSDVGLRRLIGDAEEEPRGRVSAFLGEILENRSRFRHTLTVSILILVVAISFLVFHAALVTLYQSSSLANLSPSVAHATAFIIALGATALARQVIPRVVAARRPEATLRRLLPVLRPLYRPLSLVAFAWFGKSDRQRRAEQQQVEGGAAEDEDDAGDDLQALIDVGEEEGIIEEEEGELIHSIIEFGDTRVNEVMTPRTDIVAAPAAATVREVRDLMVESKYSRLPVYREQIDNVEGLVYVRDILQCWVEGREEDAVASLVRPTYFVPATKPVAELLEEMQKAHVQLAMVIDEYGGVAGLVTVEDILEEIVGEIEDEDTEAEDVIEIVEAGEGYYDVLGSTEVGKIERLFDFEIEDDDFTTIAGLVINELGQVPRPGARLTFRGLDVEVLEADERRIGRLRLKRAEEKVAGAE